MTAWQPSLGALTVEQATPDELNLVMGIIEAAAWLHARGITGQWSSPMWQAAWDRMGARIADGIVFLARLPNGQAVGTLRFDWRDDELWRHDPEGGGYVHSFAIRNGARSHGVGAAMLEWATTRPRARQKIFAARLLGHKQALVRIVFGVGIYVPRNRLRR